MKWLLSHWLSFSFLFVTTDDVCKEVVCGKGTCKPSNQSAFFLFECECDPGWKQANFGLAENFKFLPCVVPDCKSSLFPSNPNGLCVCEYIYMTAIPHTAKQFVDELLCICITEWVAIAC